MGNVHKGNAFVFQLAHGFKQGLNFAVGEGGSGLVHHDVFGMRCDGFGDFHQLLFAHRQIARAGFRVYVQPQFAQQIMGLAAHFSAFHDAEAIRQLFA